MRRRIKFNGRKQLAHSWVEVELYANGNGKNVSLTLANPSKFDTLPSSAQVRLRLFENHFLETVVFGALGEVRSGVEPRGLINHEAFSAPSAQLRIIETEGENRGLVLGSTSRWTLQEKGGEDSGKTNQGMLRLQVRDISPSIWKLETRVEEHPFLYVDAKVQDPVVWAQSDIFTSCVLPAVVREIFDDIFRFYEDSEQQWVTDWMNWAEAVMGTKPSSFADDEEQKEWISDLVKEFCRRHDLLNKLIYRLEEDA